MLTYNYHLPELSVFLQAAFVKFHFHVCHATILNSCSLANQSSAIDFCVENR